MSGGIDEIFKILKPKEAGDVEKDLMIYGESIILITPSGKEYRIDPVAVKIVRKTK